MKLPIKIYAPKLFTFCERITLHLSEKAHPIMLQKKFTFLDNELYCRVMQHRSLLDSFYVLNIFPVGLGMMS